MKKDFENIKVVFFIVVFIFIIFVFSIGILFNRELYIYKRFSGVYSNNEIVGFIQEEDLDYFYHNKFIFIDGEKYKFDINKINDERIYQNDKVYLQIYFSINKKFDESENVLFSLMNKKDYIYKMFDVIWR